VPIESSAAITKIALLIEDLCSIGVYKSFCQSNEERYKNHARVLVEHGGKI